MILRRPRKRSVPARSGVSTYRKFSARREYTGNEGQRTAGLLQRIAVHRARQEKLAFERELRAGEIAQVNPMARFPT